MPTPAAAKLHLVHALVMIKPIATIIIETHIVYCASTRLRNRIAVPQPKQQHATSTLLKRHTYHTVLSMREAERLRKGKGGAGEGKAAGELTKP